MWFNLAKDVWRVLRIRFSQGDYFRIADLQEQIYGLKQDSQITTDYATQLDLFVMNLWKWGQLPLAAVIQSVAVMQIRNFIYQQMNQVICFRKGLNDNFWTIHSQIVHMDPVPDVDRVFALVYNIKANCMLPEIELLLKMVFCQTIWLPLKWRNLLTSVLCLLSVGCKGTQLTNAIRSMVIHLGINSQTSRSIPFKQILKPLLQDFQWPVLSC